MYGLPYLYFYGGRRQKSWTALVLALILNCEESPRDEKSTILRYLS